jgi:hypothetical protein
MYKFERTQGLISNEPKFVSRQHAIPKDLKIYASVWQLSFDAPHGRGRCNVPSLADIYEQLVRKGLETVESGSYKKGKVVFFEIGKPDGSCQTRIKFDRETDARMRALKARVDAGEFEIAKGQGYTRAAKKISLISLAVSLMRIAVDCEFS